MTTDTLPKQDQKLPQASLSDLDPEIQEVIRIVKEAKKKCPCQSYCECDSYCGCDSECYCENVCGCYAETSCIY
jgi:hypothetical protein